MVAFMACAAMCRAQQCPASEKTVSVRILFPSGVTRVTPEFDGNGDRLRRFSTEISRLSSDGRNRIRNVSISSRTSPEGSSVTNAEVASRRLEALKDYMLSLLPDCTGIAVTTVATSAEIDWEGLREMASGSGMPFGDRAADIIDNTPVWVVRQGKVVDSRKRRLMMLEGGNAWRYMAENFFPQLRYGLIEVVFMTSPEEAAPTPATEIVISSPLPDSIQVVTVPDTVTTLTSAANTAAPLNDNESGATVPRKDRHLSFLVSTNLVYDALLIPNIGMEFGITPRWSAGAAWMYGWQKRHAPRGVYAYGGDIHLRYLIPRGHRTLTGLHMGIYGQMLRYNIRRSGRGYVSDRWSWGAGLEFGYTLAASARLRFDFSLSAGFLTGICREYVRQDRCDVWQTTRRRRWFGPTGAGISVGWVIGETDGKKGGTP